MKLSRALRFQMLTLMLAAPALLGCFQPVRILAPELNGVTCRGSVMCREGIGVSRAAQLQRDAVAEVTAAGRA